MGVIGRSVVVFGVRQSCLLSFVDLYRLLEQHPERPWRDPVRVVHTVASAFEALGPACDRLDLDPDNEAALRLLGVRYFVSSESGLLYSRLSANRHFRLLGPVQNYYRVFEFLDASPAFGWEEQDAEHAVELKSWQPERRAFVLRSASGGHFRLTEQFYKGWSARLDGAETVVERCREAFQCIAVGPGEHRVEFRYHSRLLAIGAGISLCSAILVALLAAPGGLAIGRAVYWRIL